MAVTKTRTPGFTSKLPEVETTIFSVMSKMASDNQAINLSQGFPDFTISDHLLDLVTHYMKKGHNQYAPMPGVSSLRKSISDKAAYLYGSTIDPEEEITITSGATEALYTAIATIVNSGDEVIVLEPAYDSYVPSIKLNGGTPVFVPINVGEMRVEWDKVAAAITEKTSMIIINSPHNPTGMILSREDLDELAKITRGTNIFVLSDEVYEHIVFDKNKHHSVLNNGELASRSIAVFSFGKTFHATGWKVGYYVAPPWLTKELRKVHQYVQFSVHTPTQYALGEFLADKANYDQLPDIYQAKRDYFLMLMKSSGLQPLLSKGSYFQIFSYEKSSDLSDVDLVKKLTREQGVACIPVSAFYHDGKDEHYLRFCFAKNDETLLDASKILCECLPKKT